jgi:GTPase SAR1 family protein
MLVYSITNRDSFLRAVELRDKVLRVKDVEQRNVGMILIGNKSDLEAERFVPLPLYLFLVFVN